MKPPTLIAWENGPTGGVSSGEVMAILLKTGSFGLLRVVNGCIENSTIPHVHYFHNDLAVSARFGQKSSATTARAGQRPGLCLRCPNPTVTRSLCEIGQQRRPFRILRHLSKSAVTSETTRVYTESSLRRLSQGGDGVAGITQPCEGHR